MKESTPNNNGLAGWIGTRIGMIGTVLSTRTKTRTKTQTKSSLASGLARAMAMVVGVACLISLGSCRSRIADPEMPEWDDASIEAVLKKPNLKVLDIGNSYTNDATALLPTVVKNSGADVKELCLL